MNRETRTLPIVLGFDTSAARCDVALTRGTEVLGHRCLSMSRGQAERLVGLCEEVLAASGLTPGDLSAIGVGIGPGNFTGIRIAVAAARGMSLGLGIPAIGVSGFDALGLGHDGPRACALPSRGGEVYLQRHEADGTASVPSILPAEALAGIDLPLIGEGGLPPAFPAAVSICLVARARLGSPQPRPAPLYLRTADAAPARDTPPPILPS